MVLLIRQMGLCKSLEEFFIDFFSKLETLYKVKDQLRSNVSHNLEGLLGMLWGQHEFIIHNHDKETVQEDSADDPWHVLIYTASLQHAKCKPNYEIVLCLFWCEISDPPIGTLDGACVLECCWEIVSEFLFESK